MMFFLNSRLNDPFSLEDTIRGNWTGIFEQRRHTCYFIRLSNFSHLQALLNDKFLDVYITSNTTADIHYDDLIWTMNFSFLNGTHPHSTAKISERYYIDMLFQNNELLDLSIVDVFSHTITNSLFQKNYREAKNIDYPKAIGYLVLLVVCGWLFKHSFTIKKEFEIWRNAKKATAGSEPLSK